MAVQVEEGATLLGTYPRGWLVRCRCGAEVSIPYGAAQHPGEYAFPCGDHELHVRVTEHP